MTEKSYNGALKSLKIISEIILVLLAVGMAFITLREKVNYNRKDIDINKSAIDGVREDTGIMKVDMRAMSTMQGVISDDIKEIKTKLK